MSRFSRWLAGATNPKSAARDYGKPPSTNGASSMHARWLRLPTRIEAVSVDFTILERPTSSDLHFWALQASFVEHGRPMGAGHLGLQHFQAHPGSTAVNWGGYGPDGTILTGSNSPLPSTPSNKNTRDYSWSAGRPYRLRIYRGEHGWKGSVRDLEAETTTVVRELYAPSRHLDNIVVWSEVFAPCEGPSMSVAWSNAIVTTETTTHAIEAVQLSYQSHADGGCTNTSTDLVGDAIVQTTATSRANADGTILYLTPRR